MIFQTIVGFEETAKICLQAQRAGRISAWGNAADVTHGPHFFCYSLSPFPQLTLNQYREKSAVFKFPSLTRVRNVQRTLFRRRSEAHGLKLPVRILFLAMQCFPVGKEQHGALVILIDDFATGRQQL